MLCIIVYISGNPSQALDKIKELVSNLYNDYKKFKEINWFFFRYLSYLFIKIIKRMNLFNKVIFIETVIQLIISSMKNWKL